MDVEGAQSYIREVSLAAGVRCIISIIGFIFLVLLRFNWLFEVLDRLGIVSNIEMHDSSIQVEVFIPEYVLLIVAVGLYLLSLLCQLPISLVREHKCLLLLILLAIRIGFLLGSLPPEGSHLLYLDPLHIRNYLLMHPHGTDSWISYWFILFNIELSTQELSKLYDRLLIGCYIVALFADRSPWVGSPSRMASQDSLL